MNRYRYIAAEMYGYSYDEYQRKLSSGNTRFTKYMPETVEAIERALEENWDHKKIAKVLEVDLDNVPEWIESFLHAKEIVDSKHAGESFRNGVKRSILHAIDVGLDSDDKVDNLVEQICYRLADFSYLIKREQKKPEDYSDYFRYDEE
ncbi:hypothetical protein EZV73_07490 [Acidaminobacter sp. JC074]|uniref:hypothetical protein n=1 Tax=Acidaminobacter sp. JC074 TaxID=2530199 RepID=UPI001F0FDB6A|nr:hypothetical protein [Acidaminobacter sp. JC074]MCH4887408.1 hypothetical protein [Acidaminobacter sp. JC074]